MGYWMKPARPDFACWPGKGLCFQGSPTFKSLRCKATAHRRAHRRRTGPPAAVRPHGAEDVEHDRAHDAQPAHVHLSRARAGQEVRPDGVCRRGVAGAPDAGLQARDKVSLHALPQDHRGVQGCHGIRTVHQHATIAKDVTCSCTDPHGNMTCYTQPRAIRPALLSCAIVSRRLLACALL